MASWQEYLGVPPSSIAHRTVGTAVYAFNQAGYDYGAGLYDKHQNYLSDLKNPFPEGQTNAFISAIQQPPGQGPFLGGEDGP